MSQIGETEAALMRLLESCQLPTGTAVLTGPHEWSGQYVQNLIPSSPCILLVFLGARAHRGRRDNLPGVEGDVGGVLLRRLGRRHGRAAPARVGGGYDLVSRVAPVIHNAPMEDSAKQRLPFPTVTGIENITDSSLDIGNLWIMAVEISIELPLDIPVDCTGPLEDWLTWRGGIDVPGGKPKPATAEDAFTDADVPVGGDLDQ